MTKQDVVNELNKVFNEIRALRLQAGEHEFLRSKLNQVLDVVQALPEPEQALPEPEQALPEPEQVKKESDDKE